MDEKELETIAKQKSRTVQIYKTELLTFDPPFFTMQTKVSKGTYIRSLANDIAQILHLPATTYALQRIKIGSLDLHNATNLENIKTLHDIKNNIVPIKNIQTLLQGRQL
jgi:tRNA pseudouridine55 synthase